MPETKTKLNKMLFISGAVKSKNKPSLFALTLYVNLSLISPPT